jgi:hypothetical protein
MQARPEVHASGVTAQGPNFHGPHIMIFSVHILIVLNWPELMAVVVGQ